jgi:hypothetical protein
MCFVDLVFPRNPKQIVECLCNEMGDSKMIFKKKFQSFTFLIDAFFFMFCSSGTISSLRCNVIPNIKTFVNCALGMYDIVSLVK